MNIYGERGFLSNYPPDVIMVVNGQPITKVDILNIKQDRQKRKLARKRMSYKSIVKPCIIWTFYNKGFPYGGWWLYVKTTNKDWGEFRGGIKQELILKIMRLYPCGYLPVYQNFEKWKPAFAAQYFRPTLKRPRKQGMALAKVVINHKGNLKDVLPIKGVNVEPAAAEAMAGRRRTSNVEF